MIKSLTEQQIILLGIPILFMLAFLTHFLYNITGENFIVGLFFPANESVFEHMKLFTISGIIYWVLSFFFLGGEKDADKWFTAGLISSLVIIILMPMLHYLFTQSTGKESVLADIIISLIIVVIGQFVALHFYKYSQGLSSKWAITFMILIIFLFAIFSLFPPKIPLFKDSLTGSYGIFDKKTIEK